MKGASSVTLAIRQTLEAIGPGHVLWRKLTGDHLHVWVSQLLRYRDDLVRDLGQCNWLPLSLPFRFANQTSAILNVMRLRSLLHTGFAK